MKRVRNLYPAPAWALPRLSREPQEKTWICPHCGVVPPIAFAEGWYARRPCACERAAWEAEQTRQLQAELAQARQALTYTWLGRAWAEPGLSARTFETFHGERQPIASATARAFAEQSRGTLVLYGSYGTGKTHLLAAIANAVAARGQRCRFASLKRLNQCGRHSERFLGFPNTLVMNLCRRELERRSFPVPPVNSQAATEGGSQDA